MRNGKDKEQHETMIRTRANNLSKYGYDVYADHIKEYNTPREINGHIPDVFAEAIILPKIIVEVETSNSYDLEHTRQQYQAFSNIPNVEFHVVVPKSCLAKAQAKAREWNIRVDRWLPHIGL